MDGYKGKTINGIFEMNNNKGYSAGKLDSIEALAYVKGEKQFILVSCLSGDVVDIPITFETPTRAKREYFRLLRLWQGIEKDGE